MESAKYFINRSAAGIIDLPAGELFRDRIDVFNVAVCIRSDDTVADRLQRYLRALLYTEQRVLIQLPFGNIDFNTQ